MDKQIVITVRTILITLLLILAGYVVYRLAPVFAILLISLLLMLALESAVKYFMRFNLLNKPVTRSLSVILTYTLFIFVVVVIFTIGLPPVFDQGQKLVATLIALVPQASIDGLGQFSLPNLLPQVANISGGVLNALNIGFTSVTTIFSIVVLSLYMSLDWQNLKRKFLALFSGNLREEISTVINEIELNVGQWVKGELLLMLTIGTASAISLAIVGVRYPLALGLIAGLLEAVPIMGPVISTALATIIAFSMDPLKGLIVLGIFIAIQQLENNLLVPKIMQKVSGFSPLAILLALLIGSNFFGVVGAIIAVPLTMVGVIIVRSVLRHSANNSISRE